jgi:plastocyanin
MAQTRQININDQDTGLAAFDPNPLKANPGDLIFWTNNSTVAHWPAPSDNPADQKKWLLYQIPGTTDPKTGRTGLDPATSGSITMPDPDNPGDLPQTINYVCSLHPEETGQIQLVKAE